MIMDIWHDFHGPNAGYVYELYDRYRADPGSVGEDTLAVFDRWTSPAEYAAPPAETAGSLREIVGAANVTQAIRSTGHLPAPLDPLGSPPPSDPLLDMTSVRMISVRISRFLIPSDRRIGARKCAPDSDRLTGNEC